MAEWAARGWAMRGRPWLKWANTRGDGGRLLGRLDAIEENFLLRLAHETGRRGNVAITKIAKLPAGVGGGTIDSDYARKADCMRGLNRR